MKILFLQKYIQWTQYIILCYLLGQQMCLYPEKKQVKHEPNLQSAILNQLLPVMGVAT